MGDSLQKILIQRHKGAMHQGKLKHENESADTKKW